jgi:hypothetical protein
MIHSPAKIGFALSLLAAWCCRSEHRVSHRHNSGRGFTADARSPSTNPSRHLLERQPPHRLGIYLPWAYGRTRFVDWLKPLTTPQFHSNGVFLVDGELVFELLCNPKPSYDFALIWWLQCTCGSVPFFLFQEFFHRGCQNFRTATNASGFQEEFLILNDWVTREVVMFKYHKRRFLQ